jgi:hypothetical protein
MLLPRGQGLGKFGALPCMSIWTCEVRCRELAVLFPSPPSHEVLMLRDSPSDLEGTSRTVNTS